MGIMEKREVMVDSTVFIHLMRSDLDPVEILTAWIPPYELLTCGMVRLEVERGIIGKRLRNRMVRFFNMLRFIPTTNPIWANATEMARTLDRAGKVLPAQDILIAAHALKFGGRILTSDRHFESIPGLTILRPEDELEGG